MIVEQIIKTLNSTELGLKGANERYAQCRQIDCLKEWHNDADSSHKIGFIDKETGDQIKFNIYFKGQLRGVNNSENRENRIASGVDYFITRKNLEPGDEILFEKTVKTNSDKTLITTYYVDVKKYSNRVTFQITRGLLEALNIDRLRSHIDSYGNIFSVNYKGNLMSCQIEIFDEKYCKIIFSENEAEPFHISNISSDDLLIFDLQNGKLLSIDPLLYSRFQF